VKIAELFSIFNSYHFLFVGSRSWC